MPNLSWSIQTVFTGSPLTTAVASWSLITCNYYVLAGGLPHRWTLKHVWR
jgi:hypothetical protein